MRYTNPFTHSLVSLGATAKHISIHTASKAGCGSKHAINHLAVSAIDAHVQTQPVIGHLPETPVPSPPKTILADGGQTSAIVILGERCPGRGKYPGVWLIFRALSRVPYLEAHISRTQRARYIIEFLELNKGLELN